MAKDAMLHEYRFARVVARVAGFEGANAYERTRIAIKRKGRGGALVTFSAVFVILQAHLLVHGV